MENLGTPRWWKQTVLLAMLLITVSVATCQFKLDSSKYISRGIYDMYLSNDSTCFLYTNYRSNTWKKKIKFHNYYSLIKTRKGWKIIPYKH